MLNIIVDTNSVTIKHLLEIAPGVSNGHVTGDGVMTLTRQSRDPDIFGYKYLENGSR